MDLQQFKILNRKNALDSRRAPKEDYPDLLP